MSDDGKSAREVALEHELDGHRFFFSMAAPLADWLQVYMAGRVPGGASLFEAARHEIERLNGEVARLEREVNAKERVGDGKRLASKAHVWIRTDATPIRNHLTYQWSAQVRCNCGRLQSSTTYLGDDTFTPRAEHNSEADKLSGRLTEACNTCSPRDRQITGAGKVDVDVCAE